MRSPLIKKLFTVLSLCFGLAGCGDKKPTKVSQITPVGTGTQQTAGSVGASGCLNADCAPATMDISADGKTDAGLFVGVVGEAVPWRFRGVAAEDGREVAILLNKIPQGATIDPPQDGTRASTDVRILWTPTAAQTSQDDLEIYARDLSRCKMREGAERCSVNKILSQYDVKIAAVGWEIVNPAAVQAATAAATGTSTTNGIVVQVSDPRCGGIAGTTQQQIQSSVLQTGLKVLTGGGLQSLLPGLLGSMMSGSSAPIGGSTQPTKC